MSDFADIASVGLGGWVRAPRSEPDDPLPAVDRTPLSRAERVWMSRQIGERRMQWCEACEGHLLDLYLTYPRGMPK
jgi:hypothetical protein